jgi:hypothetical protein
MSSGNDVLARLWKLEASAKQLVLEGKRNPEDFAELLQKFVFGNVLPVIDWQKVYTELGMGAEYADAARSLGVVKENSNLWVVPVVKGVTCNKVVAVLRKLEVDVYTYVDDLDTGVPTNDRDPNRDGSYSIAFSRTVEADEANKNLSASVLKDRGHKGITLLERLFLELGYFLATGKHLDQKNVTLCSGSRDSDGCVPLVDWNSDSREVYVFWGGPDGCYDGLRSRSAVSLPA